MEANTKKIYPVEYIFKVLFFKLTSHWCAIFIAHHLLWQDMEAPVSIFEESLAGEPRERLFHIHSINRYQLCTNIPLPVYVIGTNKRLQPLTTTGLVKFTGAIFLRWWKFNDV